MANLTSDLPRTFEVTASNEQIDYPQAAAKIYQGSALSDAGSPGSGTNVANTLVAGENFLGFAEITQDNSSGSAGSITTNVRGKGVICGVNVTGATAAKLGANVYMSDGNTFTTTSTSNTLIGHIKKYYTGTKCDISFTGVGF